MAFAHPGCRLHKPAVSLFLNFSDCKWEIGFFYFTHNTVLWHGSLLYKADNSAGFQQEVRHEPYLKGFLSYPVSPPLWGWSSPGTGLSSSLHLIPRPLFASDLGFDLSSVEEILIGCFLANCALYTTTSAPQL